MSEIPFFSYDDEAISRAATGAVSVADDLAALVATHGSGLATASGSLETVAALRECAGTWTERVNVLSEDVRSLSSGLTDSLTGYQRVDEDLVAAFDGIAAA